MDGDGYEHDPETYAIIGAAMEVHREIGPGFLEPVYHECLEIEFGLRAIAFEHEVELPISYKGRRLEKIYIADFICHGEIIVEIKALDRLTGKEAAQVINYLRAGRKSKGLLLNFGSESLEVRRFVR
ncbi:MAG: GxxExxY protein [Candidatus Hydrogenedentes bacterium]|nr:GxxExxY protein [Candidatus Hydrogenedentota bacterium]